MIGERSVPSLKEPDMFRCLNCGSVVVGSPNGVHVAGPDANHRSAIEGPSRPWVSPIDQFVIRQNIAIYERQLAREGDSTRREVLLQLLDQERAKQAPLGDKGRASG